VWKEAQVRAHALMGSDCRQVLESLLHRAERLAAE